MLTGASQNLPKLYNKKISNVLLGQAITLALNVYIPGNNLGGFVLKSGYLTTQKTDLSTCPVTKVLTCAKDATTYSSLQITTNAGLLTWINTGTKTVKDLLDLASNALGGGSLPAGASLTDINNAIDVINNSFDGGRVFINYYSSQKSCSNLPTINKPIPAESEIVNVSNLSVSTYPNPFNSTVSFQVTPSVSGNAKLEIFNVSGQKLRNISWGYLQAGQTRSFSVDIPKPLSSTVLMYRLVVGDKETRGKLIQLK